MISTLHNERIFMKFFTKAQDSCWISAGGCGNYELTTAAAPWFRKEFEVDGAAIDGTQLAICGLGYYEVYINGKRVGDRVLDPLVSIFDKRVLYVTYDISDLLKPGKNAIGVVLGTGWYNCFTPGPWILEYASWRDVVKMRLEMRTASGKLLTASDESWKVTQDGPILFDALRGGEHYDARKELDGWAKTAYDDSAWKKASITRPPGGIMEEQTGTPIRIVDTQVLKDPNDKGVYDLGRNIAGHARITVKGEAGAKVYISYTERITPDGRLDRSNQLFTRFDNSNWQRDEYTLRGSKKAEVWEARFTYHGFQYVGIRIEGKAEIKKVEARLTNTDFDSIGSITSGNAMINTLQTLTRRSYLANFVGIPTDCPHREKNGWTGDAQLASETGLNNFDAADAYKQWLKTMRDCQRPDGNLPGIIPSGGWGFNWGNGPAWDSALFVIPWNIYLYTGDDSALRDCYENMQRYLGFLQLISLDHIVQSGLGDWCSDPAKMVDARLTNTAIAYGLHQIFADTADHFKKSADAAAARKAAAAIKRAFNQYFYRGNGLYAEGELTAMGAALYFDLCPSAAAKKATLKKLVECVEGCAATAQFGILGAKYVPRVLADNGYAKLASRFFTQEEFPGWAHWVIADHATSLHEVWTTGESWNHIMFGDLSAWLYKYPGGFRFNAARPGWKHLTIQPELIPEWKTFRAEHRGYITEWTCEDDGAVCIRITVPAGCSADVILPDGSMYKCKTGEFEFASK